MSAQPIPQQPGWQTDPTGRFESRYWDGTGWTDAVMRNGEVDSDPDGRPASPAWGPQSPPAPSVTQPGVPAHAAPPGPGDRFTSLPPAEAQSRVTQILSMSDLTITQVNPGRIDGTVTVKSEPNVVVLIVLLIVWILPGLIYWFVKSKSVTERFSLVFVTVASGTRISIQAAPKAMERLAPVIGQLPW